MQYQMLGKPDEVSICGFWWGALVTLEILLKSPQSSAPVAAKLRSAGVDSVRYCLDNPLVQIASMGMETGVTTSRIAATVWGRDVSYYEKHNFCSSSSCCCSHQRFWTAG